MPSYQELQFVLVTPERILLDEPVKALRLPLIDGQIGILPGRAPLIGRLGYGELKITTAFGEQFFFVDGGFIQVQGPVVSVLTNRAIPHNEIHAADAEKLLEAALARVPTSDAEFASKQRDQERARRMLEMAHKGH